MQMQKNRLSWYEGALNSINVGLPVNVSSTHCSQCSLLQAVMQLAALPPVEYQGT